MASMPSEAFLSHASADRAFVDRLAEMLGAHGVPVWYSRTNLLGGQQWHDEIGSALRRCDWFLLVLSEASIQSKWVKRELLFALLDDRFNDRIVPILLQSCEFDRLSWTLPSLEWVDFRASFEVGSRELLRRWGLGLHGS